jgi:hypothetical protein
MPENNKNRIEDIKRHLYDPQDASIHQREGVLHPVSHTVSEEWQTPVLPPETPLVMKKPPTSKLKKFFIGTIIFFICAVGFGVYMYFNTSVSVSNDNIEITVLGNAFAKGGEELPLQVEVTNHNKANLELSDLLIEYPKGASDASTDVVRLPRDVIGTIKPNETVTRNIRVTLFGDEKSVRTIKLSLEYHPEGSNAIFSKDVQYPVTMSSAPVSLLIDAPTEATSDQDYSFTVTATLNTALPAGQTRLQITYPTNFTFASATPTPVLGKGMWDLSGLTQTNPVVITVKGKFIGQDGDQQVFHMYAGTVDPSDTSSVNVVYTSLLQTVSLTKPFLEAHVLVDNQDLPTYTASSDETIHAQVSWVNNLSSRIADAQIIVNFSGNAFDKTTVDSLDGFYDSQNNRIVWDKNTVSELGSVEPGARGTVGFTFKPISLIGSSSSVKNPQIALDVSIRGSQPNLGSTFSDVNNFSKKIIKIMSDFQIASSATFVSGPLPPKAEKETLYNVTWTLSNSANSIVQAQAKAVLPIYVSWVGTASTGNENVTFNQTTREVIWNIGTVQANTGFASTNREVTFTLSLKPSLSQVGSVPQLMKDVYLTGQDSFAGTSVKTSRGPITTALPNDPNFKNGYERVIN